MAQPANKHLLTDDEYFALELSSQDKHQLWSGEAFAMAGGSAAHNLLTANTISALSVRLAGKPCVVLSPDQRIKAPIDRTYVYADATVVCGPLDIGKHDTLLNPTLLVEVLSDSTEAFDRGDKFDAYARMPSLKHILLISSHQRRIDAFSRQPDSLWLRRSVSSTEVLTLNEPAITLHLDEIYRGADALMVPQLRKVVESE